MPHKDPRVVVGFICFATMFIIHESLFRGFRDDYLPTWPTLVTDTLTFGVAAWWFSGFRLIPTKKNGVISVFFGSLLVAALTLLAHIVGVIFQSMMQWGWSNTLVIDSFFELFWYNQAEVSAVFCISALAAGIFLFIAPKLIQKLSIYR